MAASEGKMTPIPATAVSFVTAGAVAAPIQGAGPEAWFGPLQPIAPMAPQGTGGRQFDYPFGENLNYIPRGNGLPSFEQLRALADSLPMLRIVIEKRKNQILAYDWEIQPKLDPKNRAPMRGSQADPKVIEVTKIFQRPDRRHPFRTWFNALLEDMLVVDAATIYPRKKRNGKIYSLDFVDGTTIKPLIDVSGRPPMPPDPAYQQILHGIPAANFDSDELLYVPRNVRTNRLFGYSPVEQVILTVNIALRREIFNLEYYQAGTMPEGFATLPKEWSIDQIKAFQDYFDALMSGNLAGRRKLRFVPADFKLQDVKPPPLKDTYDEWLFRIICQAFSVPPSSMSDVVNRATAETLQLTSNDEGLSTVKGWAKDIFDYIIQNVIGYDDLEFKWQGDESLDILQQAQADDFYVRNGTKSRDEIRNKLGLEPWGVGPTTDNPILPLLEAYSSQKKLLLNPPAPVQPGAAPAALANPGGVTAAGGNRKPKRGSVATDRQAKRPEKAIIPEEGIDE